MLSYVKRRTNCRNCGSSTTTGRILPELARLTGCWREAAQQALAELQQRLEARGQPTDMAQLLRHLGIDPHLVRYDTEGQEFLPPNGT
ncbi:uncharacterized protein LOC122393437 isoform X2 [Amphibalanus amphitrite]|uniref:uncharacterized protein LOC122393437 isoform X2 n=1 Tax=Amphibalanus amphitrite TaxID=1232801 RepID=UPI001C8FB6C4|nr:uncharacterized protein LOC122393437 isoform X2 [Amphibalanus amphitrite]